MTTEPGRTASRPSDASKAPTLADVRASRIGLLLFVPYFLLYAGFMALNVVDPFSMSRSFGPLNIALAYGFALIGVALLLAIVYTGMAGASSGDQH